MTEKDIEIQELRRKLAECEYAEDIIRDMNAGVRKKCGAEYWGLKPGQMDRAVELFYAEKAGRLVVLPFGDDVELIRDGHIYRGDHWNMPTLTAFRDADTPSGKQVALFSIEEAEAALKEGHKPEI